VLTTEILDLWVLNMVYYSVMALIAMDTVTATSLHGLLISLKYLY
jgi:hypothetical protein